MIRKGQAVLVTSAAEILQQISDMGHEGDIALDAGVSVRRGSMPKITELASGAISATDTITSSWSKTGGQPTVIAGALARTPR